MEQSITLSKHHLYDLLNIGCTSIETSDDLYWDIFVTDRSHVQEDITRLTLSKDDVINLLFTKCILVKGWNISIV